MARLLQTYYAQGPRADWQERYISAYASAHPLEDWAETWAHYLHMVDTLETTAACGIVASAAACRTSRRSAVRRRRCLSGRAVRSADRQLVSRHLRAEQPQSRDGPGDAYPFVWSAPAIDKLQVRARDRLRRRRTTRDFSRLPPQPDQFSRADSGTTVAHFRARFWRSGPQLQLLRAHQHAQGGSRCRSEKS